MVLIFFIKKIKTNAREKTYKDH